MLKRIIPFLFILSFLIWTTPVVALEPTPTPETTSTPQPASGPTYIVQPGDGLSSIASRFGVSLADLMAANGISDANSIDAGAQLVIPGMEGVSGILDTKIIGYGDTLHSLSRRNQIPEDLLRQLNHITSPSELYAGVSLIYPQKDKTTSLAQPVMLTAGDTLLEESVLANSDPWTLASLNYLKNPGEAIPGDMLYASGQGDPENPEPNGMPSAFQQVSVAPLPMKQGGTAVITIQTAAGVTLGGTLVDHPLHFFPSENGKQIALQGVYALLSPGAYPLTLEATLPDGSKQAFEQMVVVNSGFYPNDPMLEVDPATIDPAVTGPEMDQVLSLASPDTAEKLWNGIFQLPVDETYCLKSRFGNRRAYNGGTYDTFHGGLDFGICSPTHPYDIYAPAAGTVIFAGPLIVRGNATIIDHGWGIYTGYWHQSKILVNVGDRVEPGQLIGQIGDTGRVTGPHLHWEVFVNDVEVDPMDWLNQAYP